MAINVLERLLLMALALSQCSSLQARSTPEDYTTSTEGYEGQLSMSQDFQTGVEYPVSFDTDRWNPQSDISSFATETDAWDQYSTNEIDANSWDPARFTVLEDEVPFMSTETDQQYGMFASTDRSELPFDDTFDSATSTTEGAITNFADDDTADDVQLIGHEDAAAYDVDAEVYFNTSDADTIYKAPDHELSLSATEFVNNPTTVDGMLTSLAVDMGGCGTGNPIDDCWRCDPDWRSHRQALASCVTGFGRNAKGGENGPIFTVTNSSDDAANPTPGTLRYGVTRTGPLWITFDADMTITLAGELWVNSLKTLDGRGVEVHIVGAQTTIQNASNVIFHGIHIHDIAVTGPTNVRVNESAVVTRVKSDGDGLHILNSKHVWVDHCYLARATDGLLDATRGSSWLTVSNNVFEYHNKVMLFGSSPAWTADRGMRATVAYNRFGRGLVQRLPRCRYGAFHVVNNHYAYGWDLYAIGGSEDPMILSQGNVFQPRYKKEVTKHIDDGGPTLGGWKQWNWASSGDMFLQGSYFTGSGYRAVRVDQYSKAYSTSPRPASLVPAMTRDAGPLILH